MNYTKDDIVAQFSLSDDDFKETLKALGIHPNKKNFSQEEYDLFEEARNLFNEGAANSYEDLANYFKEKTPEAVKSDDSLMNILDQQAVQTGFQLGNRQAQIMSQVIPQATVARLNQMIQSGELKQNFQNYWQQNLSMGEEPDVTTLVQEYLETNQLTGTEPVAPTNLLNSSTELSESDSELP